MTTLRARVGLGAGRDDRRDALAFAAVDFGTGVAHVVDDALAARHVLLLAVFAARELGLAFERDLVGLLVVGDAARLRVHPFLNALRLRIALLLEACGRARDRGATVALGRDCKIEASARQVHRALIDDDVAGVDGGLLDFNGLALVGAQGPGRRCDGGEDAEND